MKTCTSSVSKSTGALMIRSLGPSLEFNTDGFPTWSGTAWSSEHGHPSRREAHHRRNHRRNHQDPAVPEHLFSCLSITSRAGAHGKKKKETCPTSCSFFEGPNAAHSFASVRKSGSISTSIEPRESCHPRVLSALKTL